MSAQSAFVDGFHASLWLGAAALGLAAVVLLIAGPRPGQVALDVHDAPPSSTESEVPSFPEGANDPIPVG